MRECWWYDSFTHKREVQVAASFDSSSLIFTVNCCEENVSFFLFLMTPAFLKNTGLIHVRLNLAKQSFSPSVGRIRVIIPKGTFVPLLLIPSTSKQTSLSNLDLSNRRSEANNNRNNNHHQQQQSAAGYDKQQILSKP